MNKELVIKERDIYIRLAQTEDIPVLMEIRKRQLQDEGQRADTDMDDALYTYFYDRMSRGNMLEYLAEDEGMIVAAAAIIFMEFPPSFTNPDGRTGYVANVYTADAYRGRGLAGRLLECLEAEARKRGVSRLMLFASDMGVKAYKKSGYQEGDLVMEKFL